MSKETANIQIIADNLSGKLYGKYSDKIITITKNDKTIVLEPQDLKELERVIGAKFKL